MAHHRPVPLVRYFTAAQESEQAAYEAADDGSKREFVLLCVDEVIIYALSAQDSWPSRSVTCEIKDAR